MRDFFKSLLSHRRLVFALTRRDLTAAYSGSVAGNIWVVVDPLVYVALTLLFFQFAIRGGNTGGAPYVAWVLPVIIFWTYINTVLSSSVGSVREYGYLLRHRTFDMRLIAVIKVLSASFVHLVLMAIVLFAVSVWLGVKVNLHTAAIVYYYFAMCSLLVAMSWVLSALGTFWKDMRNLLSIFLQLEFWVSPIFWEPDRFPKPIALIMYLNPFYYPIRGYRASVLSQDFGGYFTILSAYYWILVIVLLWFGSRVFTRLSRSFGDVL
jgi:ABC-type polysaccharide/polyol phosphate export permease